MIITAWVVTVPSSDGSAPDGDPGGAGGTPRGGDKSYA